MCSYVLNHNSSTFSSLEAAVLKENQDSKDCLARFMAIGTMCIFNRNPEMSRLQFAMGLVLDDSGATDEVNNFDYHQFG